VDWPAVTIGAAAFVALFRLHWGIFGTLALGAGLGVVFEVVLRSA
jgi:hypothetical protein